MNQVQNAQEFYNSLPRGPLTRHIAQVYAIMLYGGVGNQPNLIEAATHSLREIAAYTAEPPRYETRRDEFLSRYMAAGSGVERLREAARRMASSLAGATARADGEYTATLLYKSRIEGERAKGLAHVRAEALRVRAELGLPLSDHKEGKSA